MRAVLLITGIASVAVACGGSSQNPSTTGSTPVPSAGRSSETTTGSATTAPSASSPVKVVALGDSDTTGAGDPTNVGWVGDYAKLLEEQLGRPVEVKNLAEEGKSSDVLLQELQSEKSTQQDVSSAQIVLIGIGGADLNAGDEQLQAGACQGKQCYVPVLHRFGENFDAIVARVRALGQGPTSVKAITLPNALPGAESVIPSFITSEISLYQATAELHVICEAMKKYEGTCVDVLHAFNGPSGTDNAYATGLMNLEDCCYASTKGQQLIARLLLRTGLSPLQLA
jgi:lysophospholipase L1-like esterase